MRSLQGCRLTQGREAAKRMCRWPCGAGRGRRGGSGMRKCLAQRQHLATVLRKDIKHTHLISQRRLRLPLCGLLCLQQCWVNKSSQRSSRCCCTLFTALAHAENKPSLKSHPTEAFLISCSHTQSKTDRCVHTKNNLKIWLLGLNQTFWILPFKCALKLFPSLSKLWLSSLDMLSVTE